MFERKPPRRQTLTKRLKKWLRNPMTFKVAAFIMSVVKLVAHVLDRFD